MTEGKKRQRASVKDVLDLLKDFPEMANAVLQIKSLQGTMWQKILDMDKVLVTLVGPPTKSSIGEPPPQEKARPPRTPQKRTSGRDLVPDEFKDSVDVTTNLENQVIIKPKQWLGEAWADLNAHLRGLGFDWVSQGKNSHWRRG